MSIDLIGFAPKLRQDTRGSYFPKNSPFSQILTFFLEAHPKLQSVDAATRGVYYAGWAEGPKDIKESVTQASAAAARAIRLMHKGKITSEPVTSEVITEYCKSCGKCATVCPYNAITVDVKKNI